MSWPERILATAAAVLLIFAAPYTDEAGFAVAALVIGRHGWRNRRLAQRPA
jgi:hypothetical protein